MIDRRIGKRLRMAREARELTQQQAADRVHYARSSIAAAETGTSCGEELLESLAALYGVSVPWLLHGGGEVDDMIKESEAAVSEEIRLLHALRCGMLCWLPARMTERIMAEVERKLLDRQSSSETWQDLTIQMPNAVDMAEREIGDWLRRNVAARICEVAMSILDDGLKGEDTDAENQCGNAENL